MSVRGDNTTPNSNDGVAWLVPMVRSQVLVLVGADLRYTDFVQYDIMLYSQTKGVKQKYICTVSFGISSV